MVLSTLAQIKAAIMTFQWTVFMYLVVFALGACIALIALLIASPDFRGMVYEPFRLTGWYVYEVYEKQVNLVRPYFDDLWLDVTEGSLNDMLHSFLLTKRKNCPICYEDVFVHRMIKLKDCNHKSCLSCARKFIRAKLDAGKEEFPCQHSKDCKPMRYKQLMKVIENDKRLKDRVEAMYIRVGLIQLGDTFRCPSLGCRNAVFLDKKGIENSFTPLKNPETINLNNKEGIKNTNSIKLEQYTAKDEKLDLRKFKCSKCLGGYCVLCSTIWGQDGLSHSNLTCEQYSRARKKANLVLPTVPIPVKLVKLMRKGLVKTCPEL